MTDEESRTWPDLAALAALVGEGARSRMLVALMSGKALTATELALHAGVSASTASSHLGKLVEARLIAVIRQGRHRYFRLFDVDVATMLEDMMGVAARGATPVRVGPSDAALAAARVCYDHLAGARGVWMTDQLLRSQLITGRDSFDVTSAGERFFAGWEIDVDSLARGRRPVCRACLDWSERRFHLGGSLGAAILERLFTLRWAQREPDSRVVTFSAFGERSFLTLFEARETRRQNA